jgi:hypothetical protein
MDTATDTSTSTQDYTPFVDDYGIQRLEEEKQKRTLLTTDVFLVVLSLLIITVGIGLWTYFGFYVERIILFHNLYGKQATLFIVSFVLYPLSGLIAILVGVCGIASAVLKHSRKLLKIAKTLGVLQVIGLLIIVLILLTAAILQGVNHLMIKDVWQGIVVLSLGVVSILSVCVGAVVFSIIRCVLILKFQPSL